MAQEQKDEQLVWMEPVLPPNKSQSPTATQIELQRVIILHKIPSKNTQKIIQFLKNELPINKTDNLGHLKRVNSNKHTTKQIHILLCTELQFKQQNIVNNHKLWNTLKSFLIEDDETKAENDTLDIDINEWIKKSKFQLNQHQIMNYKKNGAINIGQYLNHHQINH